MRITIAVDGSTTALRAVRYVAELAAALAKRPRIDLVFVDQPLMRGVARRLGEDEVARYYAGNAKFALGRAETTLTKARLAFESHSLIAEHPADRIVKFLKQRKSDLLVMGSHGRSPIKSALLGSMTSKVMALSKVPITVVR